MNNLFILGISSAFNVSAYDIPQEIHKSNLEISNTFMQTGWNDSNYIRYTSKNIKQFTMSSSVPHIFKTFLPDLSYINLDGFFLKQNDNYTLTYETNIELFDNETNIEEYEYMKKIFNYINRLQTADPINIFYSLPMFLERDVLIYCFKINFYILKFLREKFKNANIFLGGSSTVRYLKYNPTIEKQIKNLNVKIIFDNDLSSFFSNSEFSLFNSPYCDKNIVKRTNEYDTYSIKTIMDYYAINYDEKYKNSFVKQFEYCINQGCVGKCAFCASASATPKINKDYLNIFDRLQSFIDNGYNLMMLMDSAINTDINFMEKLCSWLLNKKIQWTANLRLKNLSKNQTDMLFESGCFNVCIGCETVSDKQLKYINKNISTDEMYKSIQFIHESNLWITANFITKMPYYELDEEQQILNFIKRCGGRSVLNFIFVNIFRWNEGSPFFENPEKFGIKTFPINMTRNINHRTFFYEKNRFNIQRIIQDRVDDPLYPLCKNLQLFNNFSEPILTNHLLSICYQMFNKKDQIIDFLNNNLKTVLNDEYQKKIHG